MEAEIIVADNNSTDESITYLKPKFPSVIFLQLEKNMGFAKANNYAAAKATGAFILFLNPDTIISPDTLTNCLSFLQSHNNTGAVGVRMIDGNADFLPESKRGFPSPSASLFKLTGLARFLPAKRFSKYNLNYLDEKQVHEVDVISGACIMIKKEVLDKSGLFDERFFMYGEDIDLSYRIQKAGYKNYYLGNQTIIHFKGESTNRNSLAYTRRFYGAMKLFVKKHYKGLSAALMLPGIYAAALLSITGNKMKNLFASKAIKKQQPVLKIIIAGNADDINNAKEIVAASFPRALIEITNISNLNASSINDVQQIIFCVSNNDYKQAITTFETLPKNIVAKFMHCKSFAAVGSSDKNKQGEVLTSAFNNS